MEAGAFSEASALSWNTILSRTSVSSLSYARFSDRRASSTHGFEDLIRSLRNLSLRHYRLEELVREEVLGHGETYVVERCTDKIGKVFAVKHLKVSTQVNDHTFRQRLESVLFEVQIMNHPPLKAHPNILTAFGYGWNSQGNLVIPYILVEYAPLGTMREYVRKQEPTLGYIEILVGDVASGLSSLHRCGIIHGDIKLDNILVFPSLDRPVKALAKIADFGHALILNQESSTADGPLRYKGTALYNAPEVQTQDLFPIDKAGLRKCDIWAFGLMIWEACIAGQEYLSHLKKNNLIRNDEKGRVCIDYTTLVECAKRSISGPFFGPAMFLRIALHKTIQHRASERVNEVQDISLSTQWNARCLVDLQSNMALHLESPTPTYEMFRQDNGREISWEHQKQIFQGLKETHANRLVKEIGPMLWQIALCYFIGFGTDQDQKSAFDYAEMAKSEDHPVARTFFGLMNPNNEIPPTGPQGLYIKQMSSLMSINPTLSDGMPPLVKACFLGQFQDVMHHLSDGAVYSSTLDGCTLFHWLFIFQEQPLLDVIVKKVSGSYARRVVNLPCSVIRQPHKQWPLQLIGTPLATAISVNSISTVRALLDLGADPFAPVYDSTQFPIDDNRSLWTAFHMAVKYHCSDILLLLINDTSWEDQYHLLPLAGALSFSSTLERIAIHGSGHTKQLDLTISAIRKIQCLCQFSKNGMTGLMQAIDFQDLDVVSALLRADPSLAQLPFRLPINPGVFNTPIHFASQIASRHDTPQTVLIPQIMDSYANCFNVKRVPLYDSTQKTPLHMAVTGCSDRVAKWILDKAANLLHVEDILGRTPLHYCGSTANFELLLNRGSNVNHTDRHGMTCLHQVCFLGSVELVQCLLKWRPMLHLKNNLYGPPLHCGVISGSLKVVISLLDAGAIVDERDNRGNTALHVAARLGRYNILRVLMQYEASVSASNYNGRDAKVIAGDAGNIGILSILDRGWKSSANQTILGMKPYQNYQKPLFRSASGKPFLGPDFLWDQDVLTNITSEDPSFEPDLRRATEADETPEHTRTMRERREDVNELFKKLVDNYLAPLNITVSSAKSLKQILSVYVHGLVWRPVHATQLTNIWTRTAHDLIKIMRDSHTHECSDGSCQYNDGSSVCEAALSDHLEPESTQGSSADQQARRQDDDLSIRPESSNEQTSEVVDSAYCKDLHTPTSSESTDSDKIISTITNETQAAIDCVSYIVASTKPREIFPGRNVEDIRHMVRWGIEQMTYRDAFVDCKGTILHYFLELDELPISLTQDYVEGAASGSVGSRSTTAMQRVWTRNDFSNDFSSDIDMPPRIRLAMGDIKRNDSQSHIIIPEEEEPIADSGLEDILRLSWPYQRLKGRPSWAGSLNDLYSGSHIDREEESNYEMQWDDVLWNTELWLGLKETPSLHVLRGSLYSGSKNSEAEESGVEIDWDDVPGHSIPQHRARRLLRDQANENNLYSRSDTS
ncbi:hypothetical protein FSST1_010421 [Fusarium sambucinum]